MQAEAAQPTRVRWLIFALACAASWILYLHRYAWGIVKPYFKDENPQLDYVDLGWLDSAFLATYTLGQIPCGMAGDRFGPRITLSLYTFVWSLTVGAVGWTTGFWRLVAARGVFGLAQAGTYPVLSKVTQTWFPATSRTTVQGMVAAMGRVGGACAAPIVATFLIGILGLSWQTALMVLTAPGLVLAAVFWLALRNRPREHPWTNAAEQHLLGDGQIAAHQHAAREKPKLLLTRKSLFSLAVLCFYIFVSAGQDQFFVYWLGQFGKERGFDATMLGLLLPLPLLGGACGGILGGMLNDALIRRLGSRWGRSLVAFTGKLLAGLLVVLSIQYESGQMTFLVLIAARVFSDWSMPTQWGACTDMGGRAAATVFGVVNSVGAAGGFAAGPVIGYLKQQYDWHGVFYGVAAMCVTAAVAWLFVDCTQRLVAE